MENGERGESRGIVKTARRILVVTSAKQREYSPRILSIRPAHTSILGTGTARLLRDRLLVCGQYTPDNIY